MAAYDTYTVDSIDSNVGQFKVEKGKVLLDYVFLKDLKQEMMLKS